MEETSNCNTKMEEISKNFCHPRAPVLRIGGRMVRLEGVGMTTETKTPAGVAGEGFTGDGGSDAGEALGSIVDLSVPVWSTGWRTVNVGSDPTFYRLPPEHP